MKASFAANSLHPCKHESLIEFIIEVEGWLLVVVDGTCARVQYSRGNVEGLQSAVGVAVLA